MYLSIFVHFIHNSCLLVVVLIVIVLENAELFSESLDTVDDLLLDQIEAHGNHGDAEEQVEWAKRQSLFPVLTLLIGHEVAEADGGQSNEAEVAAVQEGPALPFLKTQM